ncbi:MAG TPA: Gfo/Idh/MocA family oxidoreductase [Bacteroidia bacterium]|jgi:predicted dehydrogenase|nr:Gfo/Idh/MocA family oxidoreductase [Bacteroidia bacterium]
MYKALVIGCGNIGALYDIKGKKTLTHAKAYHLNSKFNISVYDTDPHKAKQIAKKYKISFVEKLTEEELKKFDFVSICTPTDQHFKLLIRLLNLKTKIILCEKPVSYSGPELELLKKKYSKSSSKVLVNYIRRFQPAYAEVKSYLAKNLKDKKPGQIIIKYKRGFINNGSHAFDTLNYLLDTKTHLKKVKLILKTYDLNGLDPTLTCNTNYNNTELSVIGITNTDCPLFEIEIYFNTSKLLIRESGNLIEYYSIDTKTKQLKLKKTWMGALDNYMEHVLNAAVEIHKNKREDNFLHSLQLNKTLLQFSK